MCWGDSPTDELALMWPIPAKLSSVQSRRSRHQERINVHDCVKLRRGFFQLSFLYVLFSFNIFFITYFRVVLSFQPPLDHNNMGYIYIYIYIRGSLNKFPDFFRMGTFIDSTHMKL